MNLDGDIVVEEPTARRRYPGVAWTHPQMYPGKMVPVWAVELLKAFEAAGLGAFGLQVNRVLGTRLRKNRGLLFELVPALIAVVTLSQDAGSSEAIKPRCSLMLEEFIELHGLKPLEPADLDWIVKTR